MPASLPAVHLLTCRERAASLARTLASWARTDWGTAPRVHLDAAPRTKGVRWGTAARGGRLTAAFAKMGRTVLNERGQKDEWLLFLEDDLEFHPRLGSLVRSWEALDDGPCVLASLFNPSLRAAAIWGTLPRSFAAAPKTFLGAQALLLRRWALGQALAQWDTEEGLTSQRLARLLGPGGPVWVHRPALVQHVAVDSSWGARVQRALDFDPAWVA